MKATVIVITYNHARFIAQALDSVLMQETKFPFELIVSEDCSTDATRDIISEFKGRYPSRIRLLLSDRNLNTNYVMTRGIEAARGDYIALLDGDDYWTSPNKLQKQVEFLDGHPDSAICFHNALSFYEGENHSPSLYVAPGRKPSSGLEELLVTDFMPTCSVMFRRGLFNSFPEWYSSLDIGDWPLHVMNAQHGKIGYIDEIMAAYRIHETGVWSSRPRAQRLLSIIQMYEALSGYLDSRYQKIINLLINRRCYNLAQEYARIGDFLSAQVYARKCWDQQALSRHMPQTRVLALMILLNFPKFHSHLLAIKNILVWRREIWRRAILSPPIPPDSPKSRRCINDDQCPGQ